MLMGYNEIDSSFADRIIKMSEQEQQHVQRIENRKLTISLIMAIVGMSTGVMVLGVLCYLILLAIEKKTILL